MREKSPVFEICTVYTNAQNREDTCCKIFIHKMGCSSYTSADINDEDVIEG